MRLSNEGFFDRIEAEVSDIDLSDYDFSSPVMQRYADYEPNTDYYGRITIDGFVDVCDNSDVVPRKADWLTQGY